MRRYNFLEELFNYFFILYYEGSGIDLKNNKIDYFKYLNMK